MNLLHKIFAAAKKPREPIQAPITSSTGTHPGLHDSPYEAARSGQGENYDPELAKALGEKIKYSPPREATVHYHIEPDLVFNLHRIAGKPLLSDGDAKEIDRIELEEQRVNADITANVRRTAKDLWAAQQRQIGESVRSGNASKVPDSLWSIADFESDLLHRRKALKETRRKIREQTLPIALRVADALGVVAAREAEKLESEEVKLAKEFGVEWIPSKLLLKLKYLSENPRSLIHHGGTVSARNSLECLGLKIEANHQTPSIK